MLQFKLTYNILSNLSYRQRFLKCKYNYIQLNGFVKVCNRNIFLTSIRNSENSRIISMLCNGTLCASTQLTTKCNIHSSAILEKESDLNLSSDTQDKVEEEDYFCSGLLSVLQQSLFLEDLNTDDLPIVTERFGLKGLNMDYIYDYGIKISPDLNTLMFPYDSISREFSAIQIITCTPVTNQNIISITTSKPANNLLFGWSSVGPIRKEIIVVSNPLDAVAINQETDLPVISLSCEFKEFSSELITLLKSFRKIIFWLKPDLHNSVVHNLFGQSFGRNAFLIRPQDYANALSCLQSNLKIGQILKEAEPIYHEGVDNVSSYRSALYERFKNSDKYSGVKWTRFSALNDILKGHRKRELTIFSGQTGTGKTTFVSEYSLDLCMQGVPTLWASFEISNERLLEIMLSQYAECTFVDNVREFHYWFDKFEQLPIYLLNTQGRKSIPGMLSAMKTYVKAYNVQHVIIDNLQFLMNIENYGSAIDQYRRQDQIFGAFRGFATRCDCHVTIIIHPRKEPEFTELNNASISGTAKATQEADNILILQSTKTRQYLQVTKNRFAGSKGCVLLEFDKKSLTFKQKKVMDKPEQKKVL